MAEDLNAPARPGPVEPQSPEASAAELEARIVAAVRAWRDEHIANGPIARATPCWNQLEAALAPLAASILKEI